MFDQFIASLLKYYLL